MSGRCLSLWGSLASRRRKPRTRRRARSPRRRHYRHPFRPECLRLRPPARVCWTGVGCQNWKVTGQPMVMLEEISPRQVRAWVASPAAASVWALPSMTTTGAAFSRSVAWMAVGRLRRPTSLWRLWRLWRLEPLVDWDWAAPRQISLLALVVEVAPRTAARCRPPLCLSALLLPSLAPTTMML